MFSGDSPWALDDAQPEDLDAILEIEERSFRQPWTRAFFERELQLPFSRLLVARDRVGGRPLAYVCWWHVADEVQILNVAVHAQKRRCGLARLLLSHVIAGARRDGVSLALLEVDRSNRAAVDLYRSLGFREGTVRRDYYRQGVDALVMTLRLCGELRES